MTRMGTDRHKRGRGVRLPDLARRAGRSLARTRHGNAEGKHRSEQAERVV